MTDEPNSHDYSEMIKREHRELHAALGAAQGVMRDSPLDPAVVRSTIGRLRQCVESLFAHEEESGYMREVVQRAPRFSERVEQLLEEHSHILGNIKSLCDQVNWIREGPVPWDDIKCKFADFAACLSKHETRENSILQKAYTSDIGTKD